jgi:ATP-dependent protease ClpP protease subunit
MNHSRSRSTRPVATAVQTKTDWYRIVNKADRSASVMIYDEIGFYGVSATDFVKEISALDVDSIEVQINSPGGDVFDGIAIYNALKNHPAKVTTRVDGIAASAASFIAQAGDDRVMTRNGQMMIHDASGLCIGNAADMRSMTDLLDKASDNIADIYEQASGKPAAEWRVAMLAETWYSADEAVAAGLADSVLGAAQVENKGVPALTNASPTPVEDEIDYAAITRALKEALK